MLFVLLGFKFTNLNKNYFFIVPPLVGTADQTYITFEFDVGWNFYNQQKLINN